jgi:hypothetical protein
MGPARKSSKMLRKLEEREGFEPSVEFPLHTLSKRAQSTTLTSLRLESITYGFWIEPESDFGPGLCP